MRNRDDTIVALATAPGRAALAMVRIDGLEARSISGSLISRELEDRAPAVVRLRDEAGAIDEAVALFWQGPRSFTGNDLVELTIHGSPHLANRTIAAAIRLGARPAEAGEFSERALLNGRIDLVQAEAIADLIASRTKAQAKVALSNLDGALSREGFAVRAQLLDGISRLEASLDFAEEGYEFLTRAELSSLLEDARSSLQRMLASYQRGRATLEGIDAVILGRPNAGKSSLLNLLCGSERAIVTDVPGTTRDLLRETIEVGGLPVTFTDTAGLRESSDPVEEIGIERAREAASRSDLVVYLIDSSTGIAAEDEAAILMYEPLVVFTKIDLADVPSPGIGISTRTNAGVTEFFARLDQEIRDRFVPEEGSATLVNERQRLAVEQCLEAVESASREVGTLAEEIILVDLYRATSAIGLLTGEVTNEEITDAVFSKFCIGK